MRIKKELIMNYEIEGTKLVFDDQRTLVLAMGATSIAGNLAIYGIEKKKGKYYVEIETIRERRRKKMERIRKEQEYLDTMNQILDSIGKQKKYFKKK
jgi:hypothetical protein